MTDSRTDAVSLLVGLGVGVAAAYLLDPELGSSRRALARDKLIKTRRKTTDAAVTSARDLRNRAKGIAAETWSRLRGEAVRDDVLAERVRAKLGFLVRHPSAVDIQVSDGCVILSGPVLTDEVQQLVRGIRSVRGVVGVINALDMHDEPGDVPELQGEKSRLRGEVWNVLQDDWAPSTRFLMGLGVTVLLACAIRQGVGSFLTTFQRERELRREEWLTNPQGTPGWLG
jgi:hypothetical protein